MKKVLFATTALVASAGVASADVALSGMAEMGIVGGNNNVETQFWTDIDVTFTLSGETDNGLTFGATIDLDEEGGFGGTNGGPESVFISGDFGTLTMGDTAGAMDWALSGAATGGDIIDASTAHAGFSFFLNSAVMSSVFGTSSSLSFTGGSAVDGLKDGQIARYQYSFGDFAFAVSAEIDDTGVLDPTFGIGATYATTFGDTDLTVGLGYQTGEVIAPGVDVTGYGISVSASMASGFSIVGEYENVELSAPGLVIEGDHFGIGASYTMDAWTFAANYGVWDISSNIAVFGTAFDMSGFGLSVAYDLGGGATVQAGYGSSDFDALINPLQPDMDMWSFGVAMSF